jgi:enoyl-CoA hydratase
MAAARSARDTSVLYARTGRIARITLNRPHRLNAIDDGMPAALRDRVDQANADAAVHVIVLAGIAAWRRTPRAS